MNQPLDPERLKAEIEATKTHLEWLESLLVSLPEGTRDEVRTPANEESDSDLNLSEKPDESGELLVPLEPDSTSAEENVTLGPAEEHVDPIEFSEEDMIRLAGDGSSLAAQIQRARYGCIFVMVSAIAGVLFFFFGLPFLIG